MNRFDCYLGHVKNRANGRHIHDKGEFILVSEHDTMIDQLLKLLEPGEEPIIFVDGASQADWTAKHRSWEARKALYDRALEITERKSESTPFDHIPRTPDHVVLLDDVELDGMGRAIITLEHYSQLWKEFEQGV